MDDELKHIEAELRRLRPAAVSATLIRNVERALAAPEAPRPARVVPWIWAVVMPAAAAIAIWVAPPAAKPVRETPGLGAVGEVEGEADVEAALKPVRAENVLVAAHDEGLVTLDDGTTARRARLTYVDTITWRNPRTNASLTWTVPREEVRVVPVVFQ